MFFCHNVMDDIRYTTLKSKKKIHPELSRTSEPTADNSDSHGLKLIILFLHLYVPYLLLLKLYIYLYEFFFLNYMYPYFIIFHNI